MDKSILNNNIFLSYYGDDFTGSADVMESLTLNGIPTALFLDPPSKKEVENFRLKAGVGNGAKPDHIRAFGVAGVSRSLSPERMDTELPPIFEKISKIPSDFFQYKVCSTFDSSPEIGNIGHAVDIALQYFPSPYIPLMIGAPFLNRFVVFGNLFARVNETTHRLDRHPTMIKHPITPMGESDLRLHLGKQTKRKIHLMDIFGLEGEYGSSQEYFIRKTQGEGDFLVFDTLNKDHLVTAGRLLVENKSTKTQFVVGASGVDYAMAFYLQQKEKIKKPTELQHPGKAEKMVVVAGSCSPATTAQIEYMEDQGHLGIRIDTVKLINQIEASGEIESILSQSLEAIEKGQVPLIYTAKGPEDPMINITKAQLDKSGQKHKTISEILAGTQGRILKELIIKTGKQRVVIAGGDTSGYVSKTLGIYALETLYPISPGAPLCIAHSQDKHFDGMEISLKGGQNGNKKYFQSILDGKPM